MQTRSLCQACEERFIELNSDGCKTCVRSCALLCIQCLSLRHSAQQSNANQLLHTSYICSPAIIAMQNSLLLHVSTIQFTRTTPHCEQRFIAICETRETRKKTIERMEFPLNRGEEWMYSTLKYIFM